MLEEAAVALKEVSNFHFCQLRTLRVAKGNEKVPKKNINLIATASKYGLIFIGIENGFKILKLENILDLDEDKENKNIEENYFSQFVKSESPSLLALSADQKTLAVCISNNTHVVADMYDIAAFADPEGTPAPFLNVQLSTSGAELKEFIWNPVIDGMYAFCLTDGSLYVHELNGTILKIVASQAQAAATAACWSPKGKQLVVGKKDGSFTQYKPTLQEVKTVSAPPLQEGEIKVANICWISTTLFAVLYVPEGENVSPSLIMASTPKGAPVTYTNFFDVCLGNAANSDQRYFMHYESAWGILICASTDSIEIAVIGDPPNWAQWDVKEDGKALLPGKDGASHAIGMGVMYCAQRKIIISENESYPPMPIIFFLTDNGFLVSFHMINSAPDCVSLVRPSTPIEIEGERKRPDHIQSKPAETAIIPTATEAAKNTTVTSSVLMSSTFPSSVQENKASGLSFDFNKNSTFGLSQSNSGLSQDFSAHQNNKEGSLSFGSNFQQPNLNMVSPFRSAVPPPQPIATSSSFFGGSSQSAATASSFFGSTPQSVYINTSSPDTEKIHKLSRGMPLNLVTSTPNKETAAGIRPVAVAQRSASGNKLVHDGDVPRINAVTNSKQSAFEPPLPSGSPGKILESSTVTKFDTQMTYISAIAEEINNFEKDIKDLQQSANFLICIGTKEEMTSLKSFTLNLQDFLKDMSDTMRSLNSDFHSLKNVLLESFVMVEEANSRERRKNDHSYISMLKDRALDPMTAKRMQKINQLYQYLHNQLREVNDKMDRDWVEFLEKKKNKKAVRQVSSTEAIYKTIVNNQKIIHNLRNNVDYISKKVAEKKIENISKRRNRVTYNKRLERGELSQLADAFLKAQISTEDENKKIAKTFSPKQKTLLKEFLSNSSITVVRPTIVYSPSQSRLMSKSVLYSEHAKVEQTPVEEAKANQTAVPVDHKQSIPLQMNNAKSATEVMIEKKTPVTTKFTLPTAQTFSPPESSFVLAEASDGTIYESITPPDSPSASEYSIMANNSGDTSRTTSDKNGQTMNFILPFEKNSPLLMKSSVPNVSGDKVHVSAHSMKELTPNKYTPSSVFSQPLSSLSSNTSVMSAAQSSISDTSKSKENVPSVQSKPIFGKPLAAPPSLLFSASSSIPTSDKIVEDTAAATSKSVLTTVLTSSLQNIPPKTTSSATSLSSDTKFAQGLSAFHVKDKSPSTQKSVLPNFFSSPTAESSKPEANVGQVFGSGSFFPTSGVKNSSFFSISNTKSNSLLTQGNTSKDLPSLQSKIDSGVISLQGQKSSGTAFSETLAQTGGQILGSTESSGISVINSAEEISNLKTETTQSVSMASVVTSVSTESNITTSGTLGINYNAFPSSIVQTVVSSSAAFPEKNSNSSAPLFSQPSVTEGSISSTSLTTVIFSPVNSSLPSLLSQANSTSVLSQTSSPSSVTTLFAQTTSPITVQEATSSTATSVVSAAQPAFIQPITTSSSTAFELKSTTASPTVITEVPSTTSGTQLFEKTTDSPSIFNQTTMANTTFGNPDSTTTSSVFGQKAENTPSFFGQTAATQSSFFAKAADAPAFGQSSVLQNSPFGQSTGSFTQGAGTFFSQPAGGQPPVFASTTTAASTGFGNLTAASSGFSFGKSSFGQSAGSFGLAKAVFGQNTQTFGQPASSQSSTFGQSSGSIFGQGSFFSGLGGKPSTENASKNVFGGATSGKTSTDNNLFGNAGVSTFGAKTGGSFTGGSFSSGGGSVAQSGFGAFQQSPQKTGGFGSPPAFGSAPAFGGTPAFGSPPAFGSSAPLSGSVFGGGQQAANFSNFASASSPTFGSLASQNPGFGSPQQQPAFGQQSSPFGGTSVFGGTLSFGGQASSFGTSSSPQSNTSAFTQWRN